MRSYHSYKRADQTKSLLALRLALESLQEYPDNMPASASFPLVASHGFEIGLFRRGRRVAKHSMELATRVLAGEITLYRADEIVSRGDRVTCGACKGKGWVHR
jgi:hypothetical protein